MSTMNCQQCKKSVHKNEIVTIKRFSLEVKLCKSCAENFKGGKSLGEFM